MLGRVLHTLLGYTDQPTELQLIAYLGTLGCMFGLMKLFGAAREAKPPTRHKLNNTQLSLFIIIQPGDAAAQRGRIQSIPLRGSMRSL